MSLSEKTAFELSELYRKKECTQEDVLKDLASAVKAKDRDARRIHAYIQPASGSTSREARRDLGEGVKPSLDLVKGVLMIFFQSNV